jgi:hypothetical protein
MAVAFGEVYFIEAFMRRISFCKDQQTKHIFEKMGILFCIWNMVERAGDFRNDNLISSDQLLAIKDRILIILGEL